MKKYFLLVIPFFIFFVFSSEAHAENVARLVFITKPQIIQSGVLSQEITVQSQNSSGVLTQVPETFDVVFVSSSPTGQFLGSTGKPVSKTMSKGSANKTFYYKDISEGDFVLTVVVTTRRSGEKFTASQRVLVGVPNIVTVTSMEARGVTTSVPHGVITQTSSFSSKSVPKMKVQNILLSQEKISEKSKVESTSTINSDTQLAQASVVFEAPEKHGFVSSMFALPIHIFNFIYHFFVGE